MTVSVHFHDLTVTFIIKCFSSPVNLADLFPLRSGKRNWTSVRLAFASLENSTCKDGNGCCRSCQSGIIFGASFGISFLGLAGAVILILNHSSRNFLLNTLLRRAFDLLLGLWEEALVHYGAVCNLAVGDDKASQILGLEGDGLLVQIHRCVDFSSAPLR